MLQTLCFYLLLKAAIPHLECLGVRFTLCAFALLLPWFDLLGIYDVCNRCLFSCVCVRACWCVSVGEIMRHTSAGA